MPLKDIPPQRLKGSGWNTRGYLPHFDGAAIPQFITLKLADAIPLKVIDRWKKELERRIDTYLDQGYGSCYLKDPIIAAIVEESLLDGVKARLCKELSDWRFSSAWFRKHGRKKR